MRRVEALWSHPESLGRATFQPTHASRKATPTASWTAKSLPHPKAMQAYTPTTQLSTAAHDGR